MSNDTICADFHLRNVSKILPFIRSAISLAGSGFCSNNSSPHRITLKDDDTPSIQGTNRFGCRNHDGTQLRSLTLHRTDICIKITLFC